MGPKCFQSKIFPYKPYHTSM